MPANVDVETARTIAVSSIRSASLEAAQARREIQDHAAYLESFRKEGFVPSQGRWVVDAESGLVGRVHAGMPGPSDLHTPWQVACSENGRKGDETVVLRRGSGGLMPIDPDMCFHLARVTVVFRDDGSDGNGPVRVTPFLVTARDAHSSLPPAIRHAVQFFGSDGRTCFASEVDARPVPQPFGTVVRLTA